MELEDRYGVAVSEEQATRIETVGDAVGFVRRARAGLSAWRPTRARRSRPSRR